MSNTVTKKIEYVYQIWDKKKKRRNRFSLEEYRKSLQVLNESVI